jgi:hypothetical protein
MDHEAEAIAALDDPESSPIRSATTRRRYLAQ